MTNYIAVLSAIPTLSYHISLLLQNITISDVEPGKPKTLEILRKAEIVVADFNLLIPYVDKLPATKWVQGTWAGVDKLLPHLINLNVTYRITRFSGQTFGRSMSEYVVAHIFNYERDQRRQYENQQNRLWAEGGKIRYHRLISDLTVGILGLGTIGGFVAQTLKLFGATVWGMSRTCTQKLDNVDQHKSPEDLPEILRTCDYIINVLPSTNETRGLLNGEVLKNCEGKHTVFLNIGRGSIIREADLVNALERNWISAAILDVFETEPLPETSKLWLLPQVTISPHISGVTRSQSVAALFAENYAKYIAGKDLLYPLDLGRSY